MIVQPEKEIRNVNDLLYESERKRIEMLNKEFFSDVELTDAENRVLVWLCGWDNHTIETVMSVFRKIKWRKPNAAYKVEVIRRGTIIVGDVNCQEDAEEYIENCNPIDEVKWSDFVEVVCGEEVEV